jgi:uncharacterized cupredoxin-like copper-binding protein
MAWPFRGNTSSEAISSLKDLPMMITSFAIVNKEASAVGVNVYMINATAGTSYCVAPLSEQIAAGEMYSSDREIVMLAGEQVRLATSGSVDYDFTIKNMKENESQK